jgi:hypothetical protein
MFGIHLLGAISLFLLRRMVELQAKHGVLFLLKAAEHIDAFFVITAECSRLLREVFSLSPMLMLWVS